MTIRADGSNDKTWCKEHGHYRATCAEAGLHKRPRLNPNGTYNMASTWQHGPRMTNSEIAVLRSLPKGGTPFEINAAFAADAALDFDETPPTREQYDRRILLVTLRSALAAHLAPESTTASADAVPVTAWMADDCQCRVLDPDGDRCSLYANFTDGLCSHCHGHAVAI